MESVNSGIACKETEGKEPGFVRLDNAIGRISRVVDGLKELRNIIDLTPREETKAEVEPQRSLHEVLENGAGRIDAQIAECLKLIDNIKELLF